MSRNSNNENEIEIENKSSSLNDSTHPFEWIDLNGVEEFNFNILASNYNDSIPGYNPFPLNDSFLQTSLAPLSPKSSQSSSAFLNFGNLIKSELKPDAYHQTILVDEINNKEQQQAEEVFLIENEWNRLITNYPQEFVAMMTPSGLFLRVSENCKEIIGLRPDQLVGANITNFIHINELPMVYDQLNLVVNVGRTALMTHQFKSGNNYIQLESTFYPFVARLMGDSRCVMLHSKRFDDIKPQNQQQQQQNSSSLPTEPSLHKKFISRLTLEGVFTYVSPSVSSILGYSPQDILGRSTYEFFPSEDLQMLLEIHARIKSLKTDQPVTVEHHFRRKDGSHASVSTMFNIFLNPVSGNPECILCTTTQLLKPVPESIETEKSSLVEKLRAEVQELKSLLFERTLEIERLRQGKEAAVEEGDKKKRKRKVRTDLQCEQCGTRESPEWRKGPSGNQSLCNACGLRYAKKSKGTRKLGGLETGDTLNEAFNPLEQEQLVD